jgi:hypothetical protein
MHALLQNLRAISELNNPSTATLIDEDCTLVTTLQVLSASYGDKIGKRQRFRLASRDINKFDNLLEKVDALTSIIIAYTNM